MQDYSAEKLWFYLNVERISAKLHSTKNIITRKHDPEMQTMQSHLNWRVSIKKYDWKPQSLFLKESRDDSDLRVEVKKHHKIAIYVNK